MTDPLEGVSTALHIEPDSEWCTMWLVFIDAETGETLAKLELGRLLVGAWQRGQRDRWLELGKSILEVFEKGRGATPLGWCTVPSKPKRES